jgi:hypothetical protein
MGKRGNGEGRILCKALCRSITVQTPVTRKLKALILVSVNTKRFSSLSL